MKLRSLVLLLLVLTAVNVSARRRSVRVPSTGWSVPQCAQVTGFPSVALSLDGGTTVLPHAERADDLQVYTFGLALTNEPDRMLAVTGRLLLESNDAGCSWEPSGIALPNPGYELVRAPGAVWAWSRLGGELYRIAGETTQRTAPVPLPIAFFADREQANVLATADDQGAIWFSDDAGETWSLVANAPARAPFYAVEFGPRTRMHIVATGLADGARVTFDGGANWIESAGLTGWNVFSVAISPLDDNVVWALGLDPKEPGRVRRAIFRSNDGGRTFLRVLTESSEVDLYNGMLLFPSPLDASIVYFALPGTTLFAVDDTGAIRARTTLPYRDVNAMAFSPASPRVMYFGLKLSNMSAAAAR
ncbi:MAG TPA: hypothetical protein VE010_15505 [Thermoanaerobaculia bacterium]|nr:hypothetical protein [Thermoanaerobaculia bacterium]